MLDGGELEASRCEELPILTDEPLVPSSLD
jgi:hypothetical protein